MRTPPRWTPAKANEWYAQQPWLVGSNFIPSNAVNQMEMWQADTFDPETIQRELGWAAELGFNSMRVFLHDLLWLDDAHGFKARIDQYLEISASLGISTMLVFFDDCWHDGPKLGPQPEPVPGIHGSAWYRSPGIKAMKDKSQWTRLEDYVSDIVTTFKDDGRVVVWDIYNEPANFFFTPQTLPRPMYYAKFLGKVLRYFLTPSPTKPLLEAAFSWARAVAPSQPLTGSIWYLNTQRGAKLNPVVIAHSDILTFHSYFPLEVTQKLVAELKAENRPLICNEYLARPYDNTFENHLPYFKEQKIGAYNWGLVDGKTMTIHGWESRGATTEPAVWFHDVFRQDGSPFSPAEVDLIRQITKKVVAR